MAGKLSDHPESQKFRLKQMHKTMKVPLKNQHEKSNHPAGLRSQCESLVSQASPFVPSACCLDPAWPSSRPIGYSYLALVAACPSRPLLLARLLVPWMRCMSVTLHSPFFLQHVPTALLFPATPVYTVAHLLFANLSEFYSLFLCLSSIETAP